MQKRSKFLIIPAVLLFSLILLAVVGYFGLGYYATNAVRQEIDNNIQELSDYMRVEYDSMDVNWLAFTVNMTKVKLSKPPLPGVITIDKVSVRDLTSIGIKWIPTVVVLDHIALLNEETSLDVQRFSATFRLNKIPTQEELADDFLVLLENLQSGGFKIKKLSFADKKSQVQVSAGAADYLLEKGAQRNTSLKIGDLTFKKEDLQFHLDTFLLSASLNREDVLTHLTKLVKNFSFQFPKGLAGQYPFIGNITSLGYEKLNLGTDLTYSYQPETKNVRIDWDASAANMGQVQVDLRLTDYDSPPLPLKGGLVKLLAYLKQLGPPTQEASLQGLKVKYQDFGLVPRLIKAEAESRHQSAEEFTRNLVGSINTTLLVLPLPASLKDQIKAVTRFLTKPEEIQLAVTCKEPLRLKDLEEGTLTGLIELLSKAEVKITAK
jgi:hypothetical protein